jgi:hypothetical protein
MQKLYAYVDENGADAGSQFFTVAVVILSANRDQLLLVCEELEQLSKKGKLKWGKAQHVRRMDYLRRIFADPRFKGALRYSVFQKPTNYDLATIMGIAKAIQWRKPIEGYTALIWIDGLSKNKRHEYSSELRKLGVFTKKVQGVAKDENNSLTRLADAIAGFVRDVLDGNQGDIKQLFEEARSKEYLIEI